jgi:uncharacterized protein YlbG (UPF0298 family)
MMVIKITAEDLEKLIKQVRSSRFAHTINVSVEPQKISFSFEGDDNRINTIAIFDSGARTSPTLTKTEFL